MGLTALASIAGGSLGGLYSTGIAAGALGGAILGAGGKAAGKTLTNALGLGAKAPALPGTPRAGQVPDANTNIGKELGTGQAGGQPGVAQTFLTGPGGIDPSLLNLGKATLLGG